MNLEKVSFSVFLKLLEEIPACDNFHDVLLSRPYDYLARYHFFKDASKGLVAITPEGNVHVYVGPERKFKSFVIEHDVFKSNPPVIFSFHSNASAMQEIFRDRFLVEKPFFYLRKNPKEQNLEDDYELRIATVDDQELIEEWFTLINMESDTNWSIPDLSIEKELKLYLLFNYVGEFVGGATNTLSSEGRLWIGRQWVKPEVRGKGFGKIMLRYLEQEALNQGKVLSLLVSTDNERALKLYAKYGFEEVSLNCFWY